MQIAIKQFSDEKIISLEIFNMLGEKIHVSQINSINEIDLSKTPKGIYFVEIMQRDELVVKKVVLQ